MDISIGTSTSWNTLQNAEKKTFKPLCHDYALYQAVCDINPHPFSSSLDTEEKTIDYRTDCQEHSTHHYIPEEMDKYAQNMQSALEMTKISCFKTMDWVRDTSLRRTSIIQHNILLNITKEMLGYECRTASPLRQLSPSIDPPDKSLRTAPVISYAFKTFIGDTTQSAYKKAKEEYKILTGKKLGYDFEQNFLNFKKRLCHGTYQTEPRFEGYQIGTMRVYETAHAILTDKYFPILCLMRWQPSTPRNSNEKPTKRLADEQKFFADCEWILLQKKLPNLRREFQQRCREKLKIHEQELMWLQKKNSNAWRN